MGKIKTYQDLIEIGESETKRMHFCINAIGEHQNTQDYKIAVLAEEYDRKRNPTIRRYKKWLTNTLGNKVEDIWSSNYKVASGFFHRFITQEVQYLLSNGLSLQNPENKKKLGSDIDMRLLEMGRNALVQGVSFGFFNKDHLDIFKLTEFVPLLDEENSALRAGIRYWQIDSEKPLRFTLYEEDGYTDYICRKNESEPQILKNKRKYIQIIKSSEVDGTEIFDYENYPGFPIIPMYGNWHHESELVGMQEAIDCYDRTKSGFANIVDESSKIFWVLKNAGGMDDDVSLATFVERMKQINAINVNSECGEDATPHTVNVPYEAREMLLERLEKDLYKDFMALDDEIIAAGNTTATQIEAAYEPLDEKTSEFEACVLDFLKELFKIAGIEDEASFNRSRVSNELETTQMVLMAATYLDDETILSKLPWLTQEDCKKIMERKDAENLERFSKSAGGDNINAEI